MANDLVPQQQSGALVTAEGPLGKMMQAQHGMNAGAVTIEAERAVTEARGQIQLAKMFPRSVTASITEFMDACKNPEFAQSAFYSVPNRGSGPSIRFAEEAARCYGNFEYGHREFSRANGKSEIEVYAWDKEKNNRSPRQITVMHILDSRNGARTLTDQADIDNRIANVASKQIRGRILALLPKHMIAAGIAECKRTLAGGNEKPLSQRILAMAQAFSKFGVTDTHLTKHLGHSVDDTTLDELADLMGVYNAIKEGAKASEYFDIAEKLESADMAAAITDQARKGASIKEPVKKDSVKDGEKQKSNKTESDGNTAKDSKPEKDHKSATQNSHSGGVHTDQGSAPSEGSDGEPQQGDDVF